MSKQTIKPFKVKDKEVTIEANYSKSAIDKELSRVSRSDISEEERSRAQAELRNKKKTARDNRDFAAQFLLTPQQRITYNDKIKPAPPAILHMGMNHDRANCNVCVTK
jgi:hypothetical protein